MAGAKYLLKTPSKLQSSGMSEVSESTDTEGLSTDSTLGTTVTTCKKVLCNNNLPESTEYWLHNEKVLSRICFIEDNTDNGCTTVCFANMDRHKGNQRDASWLKKLAFVSPVLPKLMDSLSMHQLKENEILIHSGLESPRSCPSDSTFEHISSQNQCAGVCLVQYGGKQQPTSPCSMVFEVNKFLIGLELCQEQQTCNLLVGHRVEDDTNRSLSSIEDDFLTASEYFDSEEDALRNDAESTDVAVKEKGSRLRHHKRHISKQERSNDSEVTIQASFKMLPASFSSGAQQRPSCKAQSERTSCKVQSERTFCKAQSESTGHYAINLAESVLQDAFICLSQDEATNATHADSSMSEGTHPVPEEFPRPPTYTFELPKIVIVQSPDNQEEVSEWSETSPLPILSEQMSASAPSENMPPACGFFSSGHPPRSVELALACAANVIGTISSPQVTEQLSLQPRLGDMGVEQKHGVEYSFSSALCGMVQVAGAIAIVDLAEDAGELGKKVDPGICCPSIGLISTTEASSAVTFQHSVAEGTSIKASCANIAEILLKEAFAVLSQPEDQSVRDFLESTHDKIVNGISHPKLSCSDEREVQEFAHVIAEGIFKHAWEKTIEKKKIKGSDTTLFPTSFLYEYVNNLLFDVLCITSKKITDVLTTNNGSGDREDEEVKKFDNADMRKSKELLSQKHHLAQTIQPDTSEKQNNLVQGTNIRSGVTECKYMKKKEEEQISSSVNSSSVQAKDQTIADQMNDISLSVTESSLLQSELGQQNSTKESKKIFSLEVKQSSSDVSINNGITMNTEIHKARVLRDGEHKSFSLITQLTPQHSLSFGGSAVVTKKDAETRSTMSCFADDLATTVVSMATELAAICLENSSGKQPWFCSLQTRAREGPESYLLPCRTARRKEAQCGAVVTKKHRPPRLSEIKRKTEEQPELMERLVNRVVDESGISDEPADPFAKFASEVTAKIMNCPELGLIDTSKPGQPRNRLQCTAMERWSRGKASSYESIPEEDTDTYNLAHTLGLGSRLGQNLSRGSSISKQSSCESITDEFSRFMVNQMENEGRGFDLLLDYYAGKNASSILNAAMQQVVTKKNGHLNVRSTCLSKQSSTESITEEFYRFMLKDIDKESKDYSLSKTREWNNSLLPPSHRTPLCFRQSSMPDRRSSDSRLTVNSPVKANSFDGFARYSHGDSLNIFPANTVSAMALCKSDSCLYQKGKTDQITDMLIHETWSNSIESLMRKNKIIMNPEDSVDLEVPADLQPQVELFANRLAADIVESGKSVLGSQSENLLGQQSRPVGERRRGFKQSRPCWSNNNYQDQQAITKGNDNINASSLPQQSRKVPLIHIEGDLKENLSEDTKNIRELPQKNSPLKCKGFVKHSSSENERAGVSAGCEQEQLPLSASSEESTGSWSHIATDDDPHEETSSYIQLSDGNGNSSASSLGIADLEAFSDILLPSTLVSATAEKESIKSSQDNVDEGTSGHSVGGSSSHREMLVMNFDLEPDSMDSEMQAALQWIAASELGITTIYFKKSQVKRREKFLEVVQLVTQKSWRVGDLFHAMVQFCKLQEENRDSVSSLFDWLLATK